MVGGQHSAAGVPPRTVLYVTGWWPGPTDVNGIFIREHVKATLPHAPGEVLHVEVVKGGFGPSRTETTTAIEERVTVHRIRISTWLRRFGIADALVRRAYRRWIAARKDGLRLLHVHVRTETTAQVLPVARRFGLPVVITEHNTFYHQGIHALPPAQQVAERRAIRRWFADPLIRAVMPVSNDLAHVLVDGYGVAPELVTVVPNNAAECFHPGPDPGPGAFRIMLAAVWRPPKDHDVFIRAMLLLPAALRARCTIHWAGYGPDMDTIRMRCAAELPDMDITFPGRLDKPALAELMREAHLFILPTRAENLPCVVVESLSCGTPVVSMVVNGVPELVDDSNGILVPPSDPVALSEALAACIEGRTTFDRAHIAKEAGARYSAQSVGRRIAEVHASALRGS